jgi:uncharacterized protein (DUF305 family)
MAQLQDHRFPHCFLTLGAFVLALTLSPATLRAQAPIFQPGAPGQPTRTLNPAEAQMGPKAPTVPDVEFMQGMIMHHSQAVEMVNLLKSRGFSKELQAFGDKIRISQSDEIDSMKQWLRDRGKSTEMAHAAMEMDHSNMDHGSMDHSMMNQGGDMMMPGMLTPAQMKALEAAKGAQFDHLFLTGMIQHHTGALVMVEDLFRQPGGGTDPFLFDFATDVDNTQSAEIEAMKRMLAKEKPAEKRKK